MIDRILLAVEDSPAGLRAARVAVELARARKARLRVVHVLVDGELRALLHAAALRPSVTERRRTAAEGLLVQVSRLAIAEGVPTETCQLEGGVAEQILEQARRWHADLIVVGRSSAHGPGAPYVGGQTRHVLEFAEQPVLVVPEPG
jgi:nucleotide-binding universal stress UspA family protein